MSNRTADSALRRARTIRVLVLGALLWAARAAPAQSPDELVAQLGSPDWRMRARAVHLLNRLPVAQVPATFAPAAIALLEREALQPEVAARTAGEGYGEYRVDLVRGVVRLRDQRALRGVALLGIGTSRAAQEFVAAAGAASLRHLDEAWGMEEQRQAVAETWAYMLSTYADRLARADRLAVIGRLLDAGAEAPLGFVVAADIAGLVEAVPLVEHIAATDPLDPIRAEAAAVAARLRAARDGRMPLELLTRVADWLGALCGGADGARRAACESLTRILVETTEHVRSGRILAARNGLRAFTERADAALQQGTLLEAEHRLLTGNAAYIVSRL